MAPKLALEAAQKMEGDGYLSNAELGSQRLLWISSELVSPNSLI